MCPSIGRDCRAAKDLRVLSAPQLRGRSVGEFPYTLARASCRNIEEIIGTQAGGEAGAGCERDLSRGRCLGGYVIHRYRDGQAPEGSAWAGERDHQTTPVSAGRQRSIPVKTGAQPVGNAALDIHAIEPRPGTIRIAGKVHQRPPIQQDRMTDATHVRCDPLREPPGWTDTPDIQFVREAALNEVDECRRRAPTRESGCGARVAQ